MSLINEMLQDLKRRETAAEPIQIEGLKVLTGAQPKVLVTREGGRAENNSAGFEDQLNLELPAKFLTFFHQDEIYGRRRTQRFETDTETDWEALFLEEKKDPEVAIEETVLPEPKKEAFRTERLILGVVCGLAMVSLTYQSTLMVTPEHSLAWEKEERSPMLEEMSEKAWRFATVTGETWVKRLFGLVDKVVEQSPAVAAVAKTVSKPLLALPFIAEEFPLPLILKRYAFPGAAETPESMMVPAKEVATVETEVELAAPVETTMAYEEVAAVATPVEEVAAVVGEVVAPVETTMTHEEVAAVTTPVEEVAAVVGEVVAPVETTMTHEEVAAVATPVEEVAAVVGEVVAPVETTIAHEEVAATATPVEEVAAPVETIIAAETAAASSHEGIATIAPHLEAIEDKDTTAATTLSLPTIQPLPQSARTKAAIARLENALIADPGASKVREKLAQLYIDHQEFTSALTILETGLALTPNHYGLIKLKSRALVGTQQIEEALKVLTKRMPSVTEDAEYHAILAALAQKMGNHTIAINTYLRLIDSFPERGRFWTGLAISLESVGKKAEAVDGYKHALKDYTLAAPIRHFIGERMQALAGTQ